jgi:murein DD-endopeptidase MepM/ murein hydrolase activator NlpD
LNRPSSDGIIDSLMNPRGRLLLPLAFSLLASPAAPQEVSRYVGTVRFSVDTHLGFPGGFLIARLQSRGPLGAAYAILEGRRAPFYSSPRGLRALLPVPLSSVAGPTTVGFELASRRGRQRIPVDVSLTARTYPPRAVTIPDSKRGLLVQANVTRDGRELLSLVRTESQKPAPGPLKAPVTVSPGVGFGGIESWLGGSLVEALFDATFGDEHRGLDYDVPLGTVVMAPAGGIVLFAGPMALGGQTVVIDHGQGVVSMLGHLMRIDVRTGDTVEPRAIVGLSGDSGLAVKPQVQWRAYIHGIAVDPSLLDQSLD